MIINSGLVDSYPRPSPQGEGGEDNMQGRTFFRIMLDIVLNNALVKSLASLVNFCNELRYYNRKELKFLKKMPITNITFYIKCYEPSCRGLFSALLQLNVNFCNNI